MLAIAFAMVLLEVVVPPVEGQLLTTRHDAPEPARPDVTVVEDARAPADEVFEDEILVLEVEIPVQVLVDGRPVAGLGRENFEIRERGERREIVGFREVDLRREVRSPDARSGEASPADVAGRRHWLLLFDLARSERPYLAEAVEAARLLAGEQSHPADRVAVAMLGRDGASLLLGFTRDRARVGLALDLVQAVLDARPRIQRELLAQLQEGRAEHLAELTEAIGPRAALALGADPSIETQRQLPLFQAGARPGLDDPIGASEGEAQDFLQVGERLARNADLSAERRLNRSTEQLAILLGSVTGQKYLLWYSSGAAGFGSVAQDAGFSKVYADLAATLRRTGWMVHGVDVRPIGQGAADSLLYLADATGGRLWERFNRLELATARAAEITAVTYELVFQAPELRRDGRFHGVEVRVTSVPKGARVVARPGYSAPLRERQMSDLERRLSEADRLFFGQDRAEIAGDVLWLPVPALRHGDRSRLVAVLDLDGDVGAPDERDLERRWRLRVQGVLTPAAERGSAAPADLGAFLVDDLFSQSLVLDRRGPDAERLEGGVRFVSDLGSGETAGARRARLRAVEVRSGNEAIWETTVDLPGDDAPHLLRPLLLDRAGSRLLIQEGDDGRSAGLLEDPASPFVFEGLPYLPRASLRVAAGEDLVGVLTRAWAGSAPELREAVRGELGSLAFAKALSGRLLDAAGRPVPEARFEVARTQKLPEAGKNGPEEGEPRPGVAFLATLDLRDVPPGRYRLEVEWRPAPDVVEAAWTDLIRE